MVEWNGATVMDYSSYVPVANLPRTDVFTVYGVNPLYGNGVIDATAHIQSKIDAASAAGGGVVSILPGQYRLTRSDDIAALTLKSNVTLKGFGPNTHLFLDPATAPNANRYHVLRIGTGTTGADNITVENIKVTANHAVIGGGSILGIGARHTDDKLASSNNITIRRCYIYDTQIAICASKDGGDSLEQDANRIAAQFSNWLVENCVLDLCGNKMVEFSETNGARCVGNRMTRCFAGPQAIFFSHNIIFEKNYVNYTDSGLNIAAGAYDIDIIGNTFEAHSSINAGVANGAIFIRTEPTAGRTYDCYNIRSRDNVYRDKYTTAKRVLKFQTRTENTAGLYRLFSFIGDTFDGAVYFDDVTSPAKTTITEFLFSDCTFEGDFFNDASSTFVSYVDNELRGCRFRKSGGYTINASSWSIINNRFKSTLTVVAGANNNVIQGNKIVGGLTDSGTGTVSANNTTA